MPDDPSIGDAKTMAGERARHVFGLREGDRLGEYRVIRPLGAGGMGEVYLARHELMDRMVALKVLNNGLAGDSVFAERFRREVRVMARLQHPHIVSVHYAGVDRDCYFLAMEAVLPGGPDQPPCTLADALGESVRLEEPVVRRLALQITEALACAHAAGVIHRDLKPANILLTDRDPAKADVRVADFGLARVVGEQWLNTRVQASLANSLRGQSVGDADTQAREDGGSSTRALLGTYEFMSPEQREGREADARSDIYALGIILYRMLTGRRVQGFPKPPSRVVPGCPAWWDDLIGGLLEEHAEDRPATMAHVREKLQGKEIIVPAHPITTVPALAPVPDHPVVRSRYKTGDELAVDLGGGVNLTLCWIPPGEFLMGSPKGEEDRNEDEGPQHRVTISRGFWMGKYPVTQTQWQQLMGSNPSAFKKEGGILGLGGTNQPERPVEKISWTQAKAFCKQLKSRTGLISDLEERTVRLPTEAEWEYACRAGTTGPYAGRLNQMGWCDENSGATTHPVGRKDSNSWGLNDMHGNVWEWCEDGKRAYTSSAHTDPLGPAGALRVLRGGSWGSRIWACRSASRDVSDQSCTDIGIGFRVVVY